MNLTHRWIQHLEAAGHRALHWSTVGRAGASDEEIIAYARENQWILITNDLDFPQLLAHTHDARPSIILLRGEPLTPEHRAEILCRALSQCESDLDAGAILSLDLSGVPRAKLLPL